MLVFLVPTIKHIKMSKYISFQFVLLMVTGIYVNLSVEQTAEYLTEVEGKEFYIISRTFTSWYAAKEHCESMGMAMASITSQPQAEALGKAMSDSFVGLYWTAARDSLSLSQFVWDATNQKVSSSFIELYQWPMMPQTCLIYLCSGSPNATLLNFPCSSEFGVFCENVTLATATVTSAPPSQAPSMTKQPTVSLEYLAEYITEADGKQFYVMSNANASWNTGKKNCEFMGMEMASITSQAQADALREAHSNSFARLYWTAARDSFNVSQFIWDTTNQTVSESSFLELYQRPMEPQTCLVYLGTGLNETMTYHPCTSYFEALCEKVTLSTTTPPTTPATRPPVVPTTTQITTPGPTSTQANELEPPSDAANQKCSFYLFLVCVVPVLMMLN